MNGQGIRAPRQVLAAPDGAKARTNEKIYVTDYSTEQDGIKGGNHVKENDGADADG